MLSLDAFTDLCQAELRLCALTAEETLVVLSQGTERLEYVDAFLAAGARLGATTLHVRLPDAIASVGGETGVWTVGTTPLVGNVAALEALKRADLVIDLVFLLHSLELLEIQAAGTRILTCIEPVDTLARLFPSRDLSDLVYRGMELAENARTLEITSPAGTEACWRLGSYPVFGQHGFADRPGMWDHWSSSGMVYTYGDDDGVNGRVVLTPGDIVLPFKRYVQSEVVFQIDAGRIVDIAGGFDADLITEYIEQFNDPDGYGISHIGWAMNDAARWSGLATDQRGHGMEMRGFAGNVLFATGPNTQAGGRNNTACHLDIPMRHHSLMLDGVPVVSEGVVVHPAFSRAGSLT